MSEWQDISTAPLNPSGKANGPVILVFSKFNDGAYPVRWVASGEGGDWHLVDAVVGSKVLLRYNVSHWMPLPAPPHASIESAS